MKFIHVHLFHKEVEFGNIQGYDDVKYLLRRALDSDKNYNLLLCGPPASAKTLFLLGILECRKGVYFDGSNTTNRILDVLQEERPRVICIDELDKMPRQSRRGDIRDVISIAISNQSPHSLPQNVSKTEKNGIYE